MNLDDARDRVLKKLADLDKEMNGFSISITKPPDDLVGDTHSVDRHHFLISISKDFGETT